LRKLELNEETNRRAGRPLSRRKRAIDAIVLSLRRRARVKTSV
jgi:hypothetical protein